MTEIDPAKVRAAKQAAKYARSLPRGASRVEAFLVAADAWEAAGFDGLADRMTARAARERSAGK